MSLWSDIENHISATSGEGIGASRTHAIGGGCINAAYRLETGKLSYFVKLNAANQVDMFAAESAGLAELATANALRVPAPVCHGTSGQDAYLVLEYLSLDGNGSQEHLGQQLAHLHRHTADRHGWHRDNTIGSTPQINTPCGDWTEFFRYRRLAYQLELAARHGHRGKLLDKGDRLLADMSAFFYNHQPLASLLHGDLWSGNYAFGRDGEPVIFDPAVYYGDRETDLAMTELFGGFSGIFYGAYADTYPLDAGYPVRKTLYNLYHVLNHLNLFGGGYAGQAERMLDALLSELRA